MNALFSNFSNSSVRFTKHAQQRVLQRFKLYLTPTERQNIQCFLEKDFSKAKVNFAKYMSPFYKNKLEVENGVNNFVAQTKYLNYYGNYDTVKKILVVKTIVVRKRDIKNRSL